MTVLEDLRQALELIEMRKANYVCLALQTPEACEYFTSLFMQDAIAYGREFAGSSFVYTSTWMSHGYSGNESVYLDLVREHRATALALAIALYEDGFQP